MDAERTKLVHAITAWREARDAHQPGSTQYKKFQRKMKEAEWELHRLGPPQDEPGILIKIVDPDERRG